MGIEVLIAIILCTWVGYYSVSGRWSLLRVIFALVAVLAVMMLISFTVAIFYGKLITSSGMLRTALVYVFLGLISFFISFQLNNWRVQKRLGK
jgi:hypothetical protein